RLGDNRVRAQGGLGRAEDRLGLDATLVDPALVDPHLAGRVTLRGELAGAFDALRARFGLAGDKLAFAPEEGEPLRIGSLRIDGDLPVTATPPPKAAVDVGIRVRSLQAAGRTLDSADVNVRGTPASHRFDAAIASEGESLRLAGTGEATLGDAPAWRARIASTVIDGTVPARLPGPASLRREAGRLLVERFVLAIAGGEAALERLALRWGDAFRFESRGQARGLPIERLLELAGTEGIDALRATRLDAGWDVNG